MKTQKIQISGLCLLMCLGLSTAALTVAGCAGDRYNRSTGQYIDDKSLTVRVHDALANNPDYKFDDVSVDIYRGVVQLNGFVNERDQRSKAVEIAKGVEGVQDVKDNLQVKPQ
jgi:hyperosmotically inducible protein